MSPKMCTFQRQEKTTVHVPKIYAIKIFSNPPVSATYIYINSYSTV